MAVTGFNQNASESDPACLLGCNYAVLGVERGKKASCSAIGKHVMRQATV